MFGIETKQYDKCNYRNKKLLRFLNTDLSLKLVLFKNIDRIFENKELTEVFGRNGVGKMEKNNGEINNFFLSLPVMRMVKSRSNGMAEYETRRGKVTLFWAVVGPMVS